MSSTNISSLILSANNLNYIAMIFVRCYGYVFIPFGTIGHLLSIYVFTRSTLRSNPSSRYFLAASIFGLLNTCFNLPMRMIQSGYVDTDPGAHSTIFCKLVWLVLYSIRGLCPYLVVLASVDRYLCSSISQNKRAWSNIHTANRLIASTIFIAFSIYIHVPIFFQIDIIPATGEPICFPPGPAGTYRVVLSFFNLIYFGILPSLSMLVLGILTLRNIEQSKKLVVITTTSTGSGGNPINRNINRQMLRMLFIQVFVYCVTCLAYSIATIISSITANQPKNVFQVAQQNLITAVMGMMTNTGPCTSFYLFTLTSGLFRKELKKLFCRLY